MIQFNLQRFIESVRRKQFRKIDYLSRQCEYCEEPLSNSQRIHQFRENEQAKGFSTRNGSPVFGYPQATHESVCRKPACKGKAFADRYRPKCVICSRTLSRREELTAPHCSRPDCRTAHFQAESIILSRALKRKREAEVRHSVRATLRAARESGWCPPAPVVAAVIITTEVPVAPLPRERKRAFRRHLREIIEAAWREREGDPNNDTIIDKIANRSPSVIGGEKGSHAETPTLEEFSTGMAESSATAETTFAAADELRVRHEAPPPSLAGQVCGVCRGRCCFAGSASYAFLKPDAITRRLRRNPAATKGEVFAEYARRIPQESIEGSCVYHGSQGCALPRELRADICNSFYCAGHLEMQKRLGRTGRTAAVVASMTPANDSITFVDSRQMIRINPPAKE